MTRIVGAALALLCAIGPACGDAPAPTTLSLGLPQALQACTQKPQQLQARLWVSGHDSPCELDVDVDAGTTSGACDVTPGIERTLTLEWFLDEGGGKTLVLAQATTTLDLRDAQSEGASATFADDDVTTTGCQDMAGEGGATIERDGVSVPVCDVDNSGSANLVEVCAGSDPFDDASEPL